MCLFCLSCNTLDLYLHLSLPDESCLGCRGVCVCEREGVCVCERERRGVCVCEREKGCVCVCVCVCEKGGVYKSL